ncbi:MAG: hypothetical protein WC197_07565, partial [Candidatus Gastranaerophilaceae bacterium]
KNLTDKDISLEGAEFKAVKAGETKEQNEEYIVKDDQLCRKDGGSIEINGPAMYFYRKGTGDVSFKGKNPNVILANLKYHISAVQKEAIRPISER